MILPKKHLGIEESLWGFGAFLLGQMKKPMSVDDLWKYYKECYSKNEYSVRFSFDQFIMTLDYLCIIGAVKLDEKGKLIYEIDL